MKKLKELSVEEQNALFQAWLKGEVIEVLMSSGEFVKLSTIFDSLNTKDCSIWNKEYTYRIKPENLPSINWSHVHPRFNYLVVNALGKAFLVCSSNTPTISKTHLNSRAWDYDIKGPQDVMDAEAFVSYSRGEAHWKKCCIKRPEGV